MTRSDWNCTLEEEGGKLFLQLGLRCVRGLRQAAAERIAACRAQVGFGSISDLTRRVPELGRSDLQMLATVGALNGIGMETGVKLHRPGRSVAGSEIRPSCCPNASGNRGARRHFSAGADDDGRAARRWPVFHDHWKTSNRHANSDSELPSHTTATDRRVVPERKRGAELHGLRDRPQAFRRGTHGTRKERAQWRPLPPVVGRGYFRLRQ